jgi:hypothetical protein
MENKDNNFNNIFKFGIYLDGNIINERIFSGDVYNQSTMYQIDIRSIINSLQRKVQNVLSSNNLTHEMFEYSLLDHYNKLNKNNDDGKLEIPNSKTIKINDKTFSGVEVKIGFYLNDNTIFERYIYLNKYNPKTRFSSDIYYAVFDIVEDIKEKIKYDDIKHMWQDYDLINNYNLHITQVRELSKEERRNLLNRIK